MAKCIVICETHEDSCSFRVPTCLLHSPCPCLSGLYVSRHVHDVSECERKLARLKTEETAKQTDTLSSPPHDTKETPADEPKVGSPPDKTETLAQEVVDPERKQESTPTDHSQCIPRPRKRKGDSQLKRALFRLEDGTMSQTDFDAFVLAIKNNPTGYFNAIQDMQRTAPEMLEDIVPDKSHPIWWLYNLQTCSCKGLTPDTSLAMQETVIGAR